MGLKYGDKSIPNKYLHVSTFRVPTYIFELPNMVKTFTCHSENFLFINLLTRRWQYMQGKFSSERQYMLICAACKYLHKLSPAKICVVAIIYVATRTTQILIRKAHLSPRLRWANKNCLFMFNLEISFTLHN